MAVVIANHVVIICVFSCDVSVLRVTRVTHSVLACKYITSAAQALAGRHREALLVARVSKGRATLKERDSFATSLPMTGVLELDDLWGPFQPKPFYVSIIL